MRFRDVVAVVRAGTSASPDGGDPIPNWATATTVDYAGELQELSSTEDVVAQQRTDSTYKAFLPADADVLPTDRLLHLGLYYEIVGMPDRQRSRGRDHHYEVRCSRIAGG